MNIDSSNEKDLTSIACQRCDSIVDIPVLKAGEQAQCPTCSAPIAVRSLGGAGLSLATALASLVMLLLACRYPFLTLGSIGITHEISLIEVPELLVENGRPVIAVVFLLLTVVFPCILMLLNIYLLVPYHFAMTVPPAAVVILRWSHHLGHWSMVDVFVISILASLSKLIGLADLSFGVGFWAYMLFSVSVLVSLWHFDRPPLWRWIRPEAHLHSGIHASTTV